MAKEGQSDKKTKQIRSDELYLVLQSPEDTRGRSHKIRVVQWTVNGKKQAPKLEKRGFFKGKDSGAIMNGSLEPLVLEDVRSLEPHLPKILKAMAGAAV